jgi:hypothetical protein
MPALVPDQPKRFGFSYALPPYPMHIISAATDYSTLACSGLAVFLSILNEVTPP